MSLTLNEIILKCQKINIWYIMYITKTTNYLKWLILFKKLRAIYIWFGEFINDYLRLKIRDVFVGNF